MSEPQSEKWLPDHSSDGDNRVRAELRAIIQSKDCQRAYDPDFIELVSTVEEAELFDIVLGLSIAFPREFGKKEFRFRVGEAKRRKMHPVVNLKLAVATARAIDSPISPMSDWRVLLEKTATGAPKALHVNAGYALRHAPELSGRLAFNAFTNQDIVKGDLPWERGADRPWSDADDVHCTEWLQAEGINVKPAAVAEIAHVIAGENSFHPVRDYLNSLRWDGISRLKKLASQYFGSVPSDYTYAVGVRYAISAVARIFKPGCKADCMPVLEGRQGIKKSTAIKVLFGEQWFTDDIGDLGSKDAAMQISGVWVTEFGELDAMSRSEVSRIKAFLSRTTDRFRPPFGRRIIAAPRQCVFAGSVNDHNYLRDETGGRRFWPIECGKIELERIAADRDQLWAEAVHRYREGESWWFEDGHLNDLAKAEQSDRYIGDPWDEEVDEALLGRTSISISELLAALKIDIGRRSQMDSNRVARCLKRREWARKRGTRDEAKYRARRYYPPTVEVIDEP